MDKRCIGDAVLLTLFDRKSEYAEQLAQLFEYQPIALPTVVIEVSLLFSAGH